MRKILALVIGVMIAGLSASLAQEETTGQARVKAQSAFRHQFRFIDENGDGIADVLRDHDGDGIPNGQDPDWSRPQDGSGYQAPSRYGQGTDGAGRSGLQAGQISRTVFGKGSFRAGLSGTASLGAGAGLCDGTGPKGRSVRRGRR